METLSGSGLTCPREGGTSKSILRPNTPPIGPWLHFFSSKPESLSDETGQLDVVFLFIKIMIVIIFREAITPVLYWTVTGRYGIKGSVSRFGLWSNPI